MKNIFIVWTVVMSIFILTVSEPTQLTYFTEHEVEKESDFIQIGITVHCEDSVLKKATETAKQIVENLQRIVTAYCQSQSKKKSECEDAFEASKYQIEPKYQLVRKVETFIAFIVKHEITIKIRKLDGIGRMTDQLLAAGEGLITIDSFQWQAENEENPEKAALKAGVSDGEEICQRMGLKLSRIISVEQVEDVEEEPAEQEEEEEEGAEEEEEEEEEGNEIVIFKFEVQCS